jgi:predicted small secreted protein
MQKLKIIGLLFILSFFVYGCNTITGAAKGVVEDIIDIVPGI